MEKQLFIGLLISNVVGLALIISSIFQQHFTRLIFGIVFLAASIFNVYLVNTTPAIYVEGYAPYAIEPYRNIINGIFSQFTQEFIYFIASGQFLISVFILFAKNTGTKIGFMGGILFFIGIAPLGIGSAFPSTILMAIALVILFTKTYPKNAFAGLRKSS